MSNEELARLLQNLVRVGTIKEIDHASQRVRVGTGKLVTDWLPWREQRAGMSKTWDPPTQGEQVILLSPGGDLAGAFVLTGVNSDSNPPPSASPDENVKTYPDGAIFTYNHQTGALSVSGIKTALFSAQDSITLKAESIVLDAEQTTSTGQHTIEGLLEFLAGMAGSNLSGGAAATIQGDVTHVGGALSSNGIVLHLHIHGNGNNGADTTVPK